MSQTLANLKLNKAVTNLFFGLVFLSLVVPLVFTKHLLYPFISTKSLLLTGVILIALPCYVYLLAQNKSIRPNSKNPISLLLLVFITLNFIAAVFGVNFGRSFWGNYERMSGVYYSLNLLLLYFYLFSIFQIRENLGKKFLDGVILVAGLTSAYAVLEQSGILFFQDASYPSRISSTFGNPIFFASFLIIPIFLSAFFAVEESVKWKKIFYWACSVLGIWAIFLSKTRGAEFGLGLTFVVFGLIFLLNSKNKRLLKAGWGIFAGLVLGAVLLFSFRSHFDSSSVIGRALTFSDGNTKARLIQWQSGLKGFKDHPILGVGPENYYVIANKYFNPEIYKYDSTWFDKPHNFLLEVLLTTGLLGFMAYIGLVSFVFVSFRKAQKSGLISFTQFCLLSSAMFAYQAQNLFVFDTTSAAWAFFIFLAFAGYLWQASLPEISSASQNQSKVNSLPILPQALLVVVGVLSFYVWYVTNWGTIKVLYNLNIAYALGIKNPKITAEYYERAAGQPFVYDRGDIGVKYGEFAVQTAQDLGASLEPGFINQTLDNAAKVLEKTVAGVNNNPIYWYHLANDYNTKSIFNKSAVLPRAVEAVNKAIALVPTRVEPKFFLVQIKGLQNDIPSVVKISEEIAAAVPWNAETKWRLALAYKDAKRLDDAIVQAKLALAGGYKFKLVKEFRWLINYYADKEDYPQVALLYEQAIVLSPNDFQLYASLATVYAKLGEKDKAILAAQKVVELNPASKANVDAFIKSLQ